MKSLLFFIACLGISNCLFSQAVADAGTPSGTASTLVATAPTTAAAVAEHNTIALTQIREHLQENLEYPAEMTRYSLEGNVTAVVILADNGDIARVMMAKSDLPEAFQRQVTEALRSLKKLRFKGRTYYGNNLLYVPVRFSL